MARTTRRTARLVAVLVTTLVLGLLPASAHAGTQNYAWQLFKATNRSRVAHGLHRLSLDPDASAAAAKHSASMARTRTLFHSSGPNAYLSSATHWSLWGENIGYTTGDVGDVQRAFMHSSVHRVHILDGRFRHVGVGAVKAGKKLWVTVFFYG